MPTPPQASACPSPAAVLNFWREAGPQRGFAEDLKFDRARGAFFHAANLLAAERTRDGWNRSAEGVFALQTLVEQVQRQFFCGTAHAFPSETLARMFCLQALFKGRLE